MCQLQRFEDIEVMCECGQAMRVDFQPIQHPSSRPTVIKDGAVGYAYATCDNSTCEADFYGVTLSPDKHATLTPEQREGYRVMVRKLRRVMAG